MFNAVIKTRKTTPGNPSPTLINLYFLKLKFNRITIPKIAICEIVKEIQSILWNVVKPLVSSQKLNDKFKQNRRTTQKKVEITLVLLVAEIIIYPKVGIFYSHIKYQFQIRLITIFILYLSQIVLK